MSLRFRLLLVVATTFAIVVVGCVYAAHVSTRQELRAETDRFLMQRAHDPGITSGFEHRPTPGTGVTGNTEPDEGPQLAEPDAIVQLLDAQGRVVRSIANQPAIPVDSRDKNIAAHGGDPRFRTVTISGTQYRVLTVSSPGGGAAQIARSIALILHHRCAADHFQVRDLCEVGQYFILNGGAEVGIFFVVTEILKGQHCNALLRN